MLPRHLATLMLGLCVTGPLAAQWVNDPRRDRVQVRVHERVRVPERVELEIKDVLAAYLAGDDLAVRPWLEPKPVLLGRGMTISLPRGLPNPAYIDEILRREEEPWTRSKAAFPLEIATALRNRGAASLALLKDGLDRVIYHAGRPGADPAADRFELLWYQTALGLAQGSQQFWLQQDILDVIQPRIAAFPRQAIEATRLPLARGIWAAALCCWTLSPGEAVQQAKLPERGRTTVNEAVALFDEAAAVPALRLEAQVRAAVVLAKAGRTADALTRFARLPAHEDSFLGYTQHMTRGRLLDQAGRPEDAAGAYRAAWHFEPASQIAATGLAAALLRTERVDDAVNVAAEARKLSSETAEFFSAFRRADGRFVVDWLNEIRALRK